MCRQKGGGDGWESSRDTVCRLKGGRVPEIQCVDRKVVVYWLSLWSLSCIVGKFQSCSAEYFDFDRIEQEEGLTRGEGLQW